MSKERIFYGALIIFYKKIDNQTIFLVAKNAKSGNTTMVGGAKEDSDQSLESCAQREILEELGLVSDQYHLQSTTIKHEFVFGSNQPERAGKPGSYKVYLADVSHLENIKHTDELREIKWLNKNEAIDSLSFPDLKEVFKKAINNID